MPHRPPPAPSFLHRRSRPARGLPLVVSPPPAGASRSVCQVGRILPAFDAGPHECLSYNPLLANLRTWGGTVNGNPPTQITAVMQIKKAPLSGAFSRRRDWSLA